MIIKSSHTHIPSSLIQPDIVGFNLDSPQMNYIPNPIVIEQTPRGERQYDIYSRLLIDRILFLGTEVNDTVTNHILIQNLLNFGWFRNGLRRPSR